MFKDFYGEFTLKEGDLHDGRPVYKNDKNKYLYFYTVKQGKYKGQSVWMV